MQMHALQKFCFYFNLTKYMRVFRGIERYLICYLRGFFNQYKERERERERERQRDRETEREGL